MTKKYFTTNETAEFLNCGKTFLYKLMGKKMLIPKRLMGKNYFSIADVENLIESGGDALANDEKN